MSFRVGEKSGRSLVAHVLKKNILPVAIAALCVYAVAQKLGETGFDQILEVVFAVTPLQWVLAIMATAASFLVVGQYDALFHRWLKTGVPFARATWTGASAIALAQTLGMGLATGTIARWRALPEVSIATALKVTNYVSVSFMAALGLLSAVLLALPTSDVLVWGGYLILAMGGVALACLLSLAQPCWLPFPVPPIRLMLRLVVLAGIDTGLAALALWVFLPHEVQPTFLLLFTAFTLSLGAGLISGAPGGVGPFELCLVTLLPTVPEPDLLGAVLAFRLTYYALPACLAIGLLVRPRRPAPRNVRGAGASELPAFQRAEACLAQTPGHRIALTAPKRALHLAEASQTLVAIGDPVTGGTFKPIDFNNLSDAAGRDQRWPILYKCSGRSARAARSLGWYVVRISQEAWVTPQTFTLDTRARRQLRRKLKQAARAGVRVNKAEHLPMAELARVSAEWVARTGPERGFSMGRFDPGYVASQRCYLAWSGDRLVGFATFHVCDHEWALDLMRCADNMPDGTMHTVLSQAIEDAARCKIPKVSLAAMPLEAPSAVLRHLASHPRAKGLRRFKLSFGPKTRYLYAAAPNRAVLTLGAIDVLLRIRAPGPSTASEPVPADDPEWQIA
ncbi:MAG: DUF2156 domain-containing protein [Silicimonas sp.]|nr:DUF2156 domain-containing protein [Silicimonas sp.]